MNKIKNIAIALFLIFAMVLTLVPFLPANAVDPRSITSYCYLNIEPNPVGVGQQTDISMWVDAPFADANYDNPVRRHDYKLTITDPDGNVALTQSWPVVDDTTGVTFTSFVPNKVGVYTAVFEYAGQTYIWERNCYSKAMDRNNNSTCFPNIDLYSPARPSTCTTL